ncbi:MAG: HAD family hydrolase [Gammaproteobacteria bacterium]|nr:HAD family hydrolase [Gammaproteobacteria bacterium]
MTNLNQTIQAILWDYDGTLVDTRVKNFYVTQKIIQAVTGKDFSFFPALQSTESYFAAYQQSTNWRDLYHRAFGLTEQQTDQAGLLWSEYQLKDNTSIPFYQGISEVLNELGNLPHGIVSQNSQSVICKSLQKNSLLRYFRSVIGYEEVALNRQKPAPDGLLKGIEEVTGSASGYVFYIGDHETDTRCAFNANTIFKERGIDLKVISVAAFYSSHSDDSGWEIKPDHKAYSPGDIVRILQEY